MTDVVPELSANHDRTCSITRVYVNNLVPNLVILLLPCIYFYFHAHAHSILIHTSATLLDLNLHYYNETNITRYSSSSQLTLDWLNPCKRVIASSSPSPSRTALSWFYRVSLFPSSHPPSPHLTSLHILYYTTNVYLRYSRRTTNGTTSSSMASPPQR